MMKWWKSRRSEHSLRKRGTRSWTCEDDRSLHLAGILLIEWQIKPGQALWFLTNKTISCNDKSFACFTFCKIQPEKIQSTNIFLPAVQSALPTLRKYWNDCKFLWVCFVFYKIFFYLGKAMPIFYIFHICFCSFDVMTFIIIIINQALLSTIYKMTGGQLNIVHSIHIFHRQMQSELFKRSEILETFLQSNTSPIPKPCITSSQLYHFVVVVLNAMANVDFHENSRDTF